MNAKAHELADKAEMAIEDVRRQIAELGKVLSLIEVNTRQAACYTLTLCQAVTDNAAELQTDNAAGE